MYMYHIYIYIYIYIYRFHVALLSNLLTSVKYSHTCQFDLEHLCIPLSILV